MIPSTPLKVTRCRSCDADIVWVVTQAGKRMPIDAVPSAEGRFWLTGTRVATSSGMAPAVRYLRDNEISGDHTERHTSHFATCPNADQHRH